MTKVSALCLLLLIFVICIEARGRRPRPPPKRPPPPPETTLAPTVAPNPTSGPTTEAPSGVSAIARQVLDMVQEGIDYNGSVLGLYNTCWLNTYSQWAGTVVNCAENAVGYFEEIDYDEDWRIIITSGAPNHAAEEESTPFCTAYTDICHAINPLINGGLLNPNRRCEKWQYVVLPKNPVATGVFSDTPMGATGLATSGGHIYNHLANPDGSVAWFHEIQSLDLGMGHSDMSSNYHYHGVPYLIPGADDAAACTKVGYLFDGFPVYGRCEDEDGNEMMSCWKLIDGQTGENFSHYEYDQAGFEAGTCHLDKANGGMVGGAYGYVATTNFPGVPMFYSGTSVPRTCGFCPEEKDFC